MRASQPRGNRCRSRHTDRPRRFSKISRHVRASYDGSAALTVDARDAGLVGRARHDPNYSRETNALAEFGARADHVERRMYPGPHQPSFDDGAVQHCLLRLIVLRSFDKRDERVPRVVADNLIPSLELNNVAVIESGSTENRRGKGAWDIAAGDACECRKAWVDPLRKGHFDIGPAILGSRLRSSHTRDARGYGRRNGLAAACPREDNKAEHRVSHRVTPFNVGIGNGPIK